MGQNASNSVEIANIFGWNSIVYSGGSLTLQPEGGGNKVTFYPLEVGHLPGPGRYRIIGRSIPRDTNLNKRPIPQWILKGFGDMPRYNIADPNLTIVEFGSNGSYGFAAS